MAKLWQWQSINNVSNVNTMALKIPGWRNGG